MSRPRAGPKTPGPGPKPPPKPPRWCGGEPPRKSAGVCDADTGQAGSRRKAQQQQLQRCNSNMWLMKVAGATSNKSPGYYMVSCCMHKRLNTAHKHTYHVALFLKNNTMWEGHMYVILSCSCKHHGTMPQTPGLLCAARMRLHATNLGCHNSRYSATSTTRQGTTTSCHM